MQQGSFWQGGGEETSQVFTSPAHDRCTGPECHPSLAQGWNHLMQKKFWLVKAKPVWHLNRGQIAHPSSRASAEVPVLTGAPHS